MSEDGWVALEFVVVVLALMLPVAYAVDAVNRVHQGSLAVESAAGQAALAVARGSLSPEAVPGWVRRISGPGVSASVRCECGGPVGYVTVAAESSVALPLLPDAVIDRVGRVRVTARHTEVVDRWAGTP